MKKLKDQNVKGTMDYLPEEEVIRRNIRRTLEDKFIQYNCLPLETPILNKQELMASKYAGGAEILEEMYSLSDRGERELALRYDLTIPFAKVVAMNPDLQMPFKRYEIGKVFRDGPVKPGRFREFTQCDVDITGVDSQLAEAELMEMAFDIFDKLNLDVTIQYNNRKLLSGLLDSLSIPNPLLNDVILTLDKLEKIGMVGVKKELQKKGIASQSIRRVEKGTQDWIDKDISYFKKFSSVNEKVEKGLLELEELTSYLEGLGLQNRCKFNPFLARGLDIYTGTIYEIFLADQSITSSIGSGGRYDSAIGGLLGTDEPVSTVGISFGLDVILTAIKSKEIALVKDEKPDYLIIPIGAKREALIVASTYRNKGYRTELDMSGKRTGKSLDRANKRGINQVILVGEQEVERNEIVLKLLNEGTEERLSFQF
ncbi:histidine--tRNA ligase [Pseudalkalibacillus hwajinpoensis]|uniref:Histidine--tRNA ligase n=1 Tax=Guptibacillus hwajinpoensis TaxID=208199 RepID=A0A4U1MPK7_9BACL|nr:histidine--tRNA ligase [Pseudalkalibacillus hwajinpoensis]TKD72460.1 histidine--tRNA ligase [Pseudalkalibacillus hwajinpoensis]